MLVVMKAQATEEQVRAVCERVESLGFRAHAIPGAQRTAIGITGKGIDAMLKSSGLKVSQYYPGNWKENPGIYFQDVLILEKDA